MAAEYEFEHTTTREEAAAMLQEVTDGIAAGVLLLGQEDEGWSLDVPDEVTVELELESEDGETGVEIELEWLDPDVEETASVIEDVAESSEEGEELPLGPAETGESLARFEVFRDQADEWRWRLVHQNGNVIATSGEGYTRKHNAMKGLRSVRRNSPNAELVDQSET